MVLTIMSVADPDSLILTAGCQSQVDLRFLLLPLSVQPAFCAMPLPRVPDYRSRPGGPATATDIQE